MQEQNLPEAWISHEYMASNNLGDQSSSAFLHASLKDDTKDPVVRDILFSSE